MVDNMGKPLAKLDDWRGVKDPKKRKQIQDRLAQRARRRRLAQQKTLAGPGPEGTKATADLFFEPSSVSVCRVQCHDAPAISFGAFTSTPFAVSGSRILEIVVPKVMHEAYLPASCHSAYAALYDNGQLLGLSCSTVNRCRSRYNCTNLPYYLRPTKLQKEACHPQWVDRFPFPYMRDACISSLDCLGEENFVADLFRMPSFVVLHGYPSWDPAGWIMTEIFKAKWGHLFFPDQSEATKLTQIT